MFRSKTTRSQAALFLLLLLLCTSVPKRVVHLMLGGHEKTALHQQPGDRDHLDKAGYDCDCNLFVSTSPFTYFLSPVITPGVVLQASLIVNYLQPGTQSNHHFSFTLRGPPPNLLPAFG